MFSFCLDDANKLFNDTKSIKANHLIKGEYKLKWLTKGVNSIAFKYFAIMLILFSSLVPAFPQGIVLADGSIGTTADEGTYGNIQNDGEGRDHERAKINKQVSFGDKPGEYFIDLSIEGKDNTQIDTTDIVLVYDNSGSMRTNNRVGIAKDATTDFVDNLLTADNEGFQIALVTYGSAVFDGRNRSWADSPGLTDNYSHKTLTKNPNDITSKIPSDVPGDRGGDVNTWHGGTFTQQGLEEAGKILAGSTADNKVIITITDGVPTLSYNNNNQPRGNGTNFFLSGTSGSNHGTPTINEAASLKQNYELYTIALEMTGDGGASEDQAREVVQGISSSVDHSYEAAQVSQMVGYLNEIAQKLNSSVVDGSVEDPMGEYFVLQGADNFTPANDADLSDGDYYLSGNDSSLIDGVTVTTEGQKININGLNLGEGEKVQLRYKVQIDTDKAGFQADELYRTNGVTTLTPRPNDSPNVFPEPWASAKGIQVSGEKNWEDYGYEGNRPENITVNLMRPGYDEPVNTAVVTPDAEGNWIYEFEDAIWYDSSGEIIEYYATEEVVDGYEMDAPADRTDNLIITNTLDANPAIELTKVAKSTSDQGEDVLEVGKDIEYTFTITNTGNLPLTNIDLSDELEGISDIEYQTLNEADFTGDIATLVFNPGDVLVATATYGVTQMDFDYGQVQNNAEVVGDPFGYDPTDPNSPQPVEDDDNANVPGELTSAISLEKTTPTTTVALVGEEISYTFVITNIGNTTLTNITLEDPMLGGEIALDETVLQPDESTTVTQTYLVTQADIDAGEILNTANVEGTPPPAYTDNPDNPNTVTDEDSEDVDVNQEPAIELIKEANEDELVAGTTIEYTFTATNTGNTTLTKVNLVDELEGLSEITYIAVDGVPVVDADNITLEPNQVLTASATYDVTQADIDYGQVHNIATVEGTPPLSDEPVTDEDEKWVPHDPELSIELVKTSDKQVVTEAGEEIEFTFTVTNTSSVTLVDVNVSDPMLEDLNIDIVLDRTTLLPGQSTTGTATYTVTEADISAGTITNLATVTGTPPNPEDPNPEDPSEVEVLVAKIDLEKSSTPGIFTEAGQEITYLLNVTNTGEVTLNNIVLKDEKLGGVIELSVDSLEPGESTEVEVPYTVTAADVTAGEILNTADVVGEPEGYDSTDPDSPQPVTAEDNDEALYSGLSLVKTSDKTEVTAAGEEIIFSFEVTNTGKVALENIVVNDPMLEELGIDIELANSTLAPGESTIGTATYTVTQQDMDNGGITNVATATGTPPGFDPEDPNFPDEPPVSPPSEEEVPALYDPAIDLTKEANIDEFAAVGQEIEYTFTVENTGNVTLTYVMVDDETFKASIVLVKDPDDHTQPVTLAPGETATGTLTYTVTQEDLDNGEVFNEANTTGTPPPVIDPEDPENPVERDPVTDEDTETVVGSQNPGLTLEKTSDAEEVTQAGDQITYTLTVTNTGNVTLEDVTVYDEMLGGDLDVSPSTLLPGETGTVTGTYTVTQADIDNLASIDNIATATGTPPGNDPDDPENPETPPVEEDVPVKKDPAITLVKQADKEVLVEGETVTYTFTATNTGNLTLSNVNITDILEGISEIQYLSINGEEITDASNITLAPADVLVATATYVVTQDDVDSNEVLNHATVQGTPPAVEDPDNPGNVIEQDPVEDDDLAKVPSEHKPAIELEKSSDKVEVSEVGEVITYKFTITNTGNVTLDNIEVNDPMLDALNIEIEYEKTYLVPGESTVAYAAYTVTQDDIDNKNEIQNVATATGNPPAYNPEDPTTDPEDPGYPPVSPPSEEEVPVVKDPEIQIEKSSDVEEVNAAGDVVTYTFVITNTGNVTLTDVELNDPMLGDNIELEQTTLLPNESIKVSIPYEVTQADIDNGLIKNVALTTGTPPGFDPEDPDSPKKPEDEDEVNVPTNPQPNIEIVKTSDVDKVYAAGDKVIFIFEATNTGNVTLTDVTVTDEMLSAEPIAVTPSTLAPGESGTVSVEYTVTEEDYERGYVYNVATSTGTPPTYDPEYPIDPDKPDPNEPPVSPPDEVTIVTKHPEIQLIKTNDTQVISEAGQVVTYTFKVKNAGNVTLHDIVIKDPMFNDEGIKINLPKTSLEPGETTEAYARYIVKPEDLENPELVNLATTTGIPEGYNPEDPKSPQPPTDEDEEITPTEKGQQGPAIQLEKTSDIKQVTEVGEKITYTFKVTNIGNLTLENVEVNDPMLAGDIVLAKTTLAPGESTTGTGVYEVTEEDLAKTEITNVATTTGIPEGYDPEDPNSPQPPVDEDEDKVYPGENLPNFYPAIKLLKTSDTEIITEEGQVVTYFFKVTNTGDVTLEDVALFDPMLGGAIALDKTKLAPGEFTYGTATYTATRADLGKVELPNEAKTFGYSPGYTGERFEIADLVTLEDLEEQLAELEASHPGTVPEDIDEDIIPTTGASIQLIKTSDTAEVTEAGQVITYIFKVKNTGGVTLEDVKVDDPMLGGDITLDKTTLEPGETTLGYAEYVVTEADLEKDELENIATTTGIPEGHDPEDPTSPQPPTDEDEDITPTEKGNERPAIQLEKISDKDVINVVGEIVTYTFNVTNIGGVTLNEVEVNDPMLGGQVELESTTLAPGESTTGTAEYIVQEADLNQFSMTNVATTTGTPEGYNENDPDRSERPTDEDEDIIYPFIVPPGMSAIKLLKTSNTLSVANAGDIVEYTFKVTNTGHVTLTNLTLVDPLIGGEIELEKTKLAPGEFTYGTGEYVATQEDIDNGYIPNLATVEGTPPGYDENDPNSPEKPTDEDDFNVPTDRSPALELVKSSDKEEVENVGDIITYTFDVTNTGNVTLDNVEVIDEMLAEAGIEVVLDETTLAPGESTIGSAEYIVTQADLDSGLIENIATATGTPPGYDPEDPTTDPNDPTYPPVSPPSQEDVPTVQNPSIELVKTSDKEEVTKVGEVVTYSFEITNTGNVTLYNVTLDDPMLGGVLELETDKLFPGETTTVSQTYIVTEADLANDTITNVATVTGETENNTTVHHEDEVVIESNEFVPPTPAEPTEPSKPVGKDLPKTATNIYNLLAIGLSILILGIAIALYQRRRQTN